MNLGKLNAKLLFTFSGNKFPASKFKPFQNLSLYILKVTHQQCQVFTTLLILAANREQGPLLCKEGEGGKDNLQKIAYLYKVYKSLYIKFRKPSQFLFWHLQPSAPGRALSWRLPQG